MCAKGGQISENGSYALRTNELTRIDDKEEAGYAIK